MAFLKKFTFTLFVFITVIALVVFLVSLNLVLGAKSEVEIKLPDNFVHKKITDQKSTSLALSTSTSAFQAIKSSILTIPNPQRLIIPSQNIDAYIEQVGITNEEKMATPHDSANVGWYKYGSAPGEPGNAVIDGHLDTNFGAPAVFYHINRLHAGDMIYVADEQGRQLRFVVTYVKLYDHDTSSTDTIFSTSGKPRLVLITCGGSWIHTARTYSERFVVFADLQL